MIGSGGTFTTLAEMIQAEREGQPGNVQGYQITRAEIVRLLRRLLETPIDARRRMPGLNPERADIVIAGAAVIARLAKYLGCQQILVNERGIRDGLMLSMIHDLPGASIAAAPQSKDRLEWVRLFARRCHSNERHCEHVARLGAQIFDALRESRELPDEAREILHAATLLHDIGYLINHSTHHKHAYHLILHSDLPGFSAREIELIANVARYHRRACPKKSHSNFARLGRSDRELVRQLSGILRLADGLDRTHTQSIRTVRCETNDGRLLLSLEADTDPQVEIWDAERKAGLFESVFDTTIELSWSKKEEVRAVRPLRATAG
jgi:exopolyphosphatase/guanosine-5'-triphosphate,3'-diphosphate pyrophosphatase